MLSKIKKIKDFGILDNFRPTQAIQPFNIFNLIYGWNGSGKTTLGRLIRCLELKANHVEYPNSDFIIELSDASKIDSKTYSHNQNIRVFNHDFINENLNLFDAQTKPIIFISKEKVEEKKELDKQKIELAKKEGSKLVLLDQEKKLSKQVEDFHKDAGKAIKDFLLGTIYANVTYNKATSIKIWAKLKELKQELKKFEMDDSSLLNEKTYTLSNSKKDEIPIAIIPQPIEIEKITEIELEVNQLLSVSITSKVIERLRDNPNIGKWVSEGLVLHMEINGENCEFCGQKLPESKIAELESHYSTQYTELIKNLNNTISKIEKGIRQEVLNSNHLLYDELKQQYDIIIESINEKIRVLNESGKCKGTRHRKEIFNPTFGRFR